MSETELDKQLQDIDEDIKDLEQLLTSATRDRSKNLLKNEISKVEALKKATLEKLNQLKIREQKKLEQSRKDEDPLTKQKVVYTKIDKFGWDQKGDTVQIYILSGVDGIGKHPKEKIDCEFNDESVDLRILDFNGKNLRLVINPLNSLTDPAQGKLKVKSNSITIELKKKENKYWGDIKPKARAYEQKDDDGNKDPEKSLMSMVKDLYQSGDTEMKKSIEEAFEKQKQRDMTGSPF